MSEAAQGRSILVTLLDVDTGSVGEPHLRARDQVALAAVKQRPVVWPLVFQRIVQVIAGPLGIEETRANLSTASEVAVGRLSVDPEALRQAIAAAHPDATIVFSTT